MKIERFEVVGLLGRPSPRRATFSKDLNILTGRNGAGKTSFLKLIWYMMSGNIALALREIEFSKATLVTDEYECILHKLSRATCRVEFTGGGRKRIFEDIVDPEEDIVIDAEDQANAVLIEHGKSVYFPTFRRIEGGYSLSSSRSKSTSALSGVRGRNDVENALVTLSSRISHENHIFVSSISTVDIVSLLLRQYADLSEVYNTIQQNTSQEIIETIKAFKSDRADRNQISAATQVIDAIRKKIEGMENRREEVMRPIEAVREQVTKLFDVSGISFGTRLSFGDAATAINSDQLSAGEKQMLSFICYNAFYDNSVIFIDEPELSLHPDWQRQLFPVLLRQQSSNQFVVASHSPFIYSKYPDKEIPIVRDRGDRGR